MAFVVGVAAGGTLAETSSLALAVTFGCGVVALGAGFGALVEANNQRQDRVVLDAHAMVSIVNLKGVIVAVNDGLCQATGYTADDLIGQSSFDRLYFSEDRGLFLNIRAQIENGRRWTGESRIRTQEGQEIWTKATVLPRRNLFGRVDSAIIVRTNISETRQAKSRMQLVRTLDNLVEQVAIFRAEDGMVEYLNSSAMVLFGGPEREQTRFRLSDAKSSFDGAALREEVTRLLAEQLDYADFVTAIDGTPYDVRVQKVDGEASDTRIIAIFRDRTVKEAMEREKSQFVSTVSHELRTPLTSIKGAIGLILGQPNSGMQDKSRELLSIAQRNADRLVLIVNDILDLEKMDAGEMPFHMQPLTLRSIVDDAVEANRPYFDELSVGCQVVESTGDSPRVEADPDRMSQVLTNLLSNAAKFSRTGEIVSVELWQRGDEAGFTVTDRGMGIPKPEIETIFERFRQVTHKSRSQKGGTGLGLAIVKTIVERHGGRVWIESVENEGTSVHCALPIGTVSEGILQASA